MLRVTQIAKLLYPLNAEEVVDDVDDDNDDDNENSANNGGN